MDIEIKEVIGTQAWQGLLMAIVKGTAHLINMEIDSSVSFLHSQLSQHTHDRASIFSINFDTI